MSVPSHRRVVPAGDAAIRRAVAVLRAGGLVAFPTETVYGLGADAANPAAVRRLYAVKGRPADHPVIVHLAGADRVEGWAASFPDAARTLAAAFWPGPLTLLVLRGPLVADEVTGGRATVGLRVPDHPVASALLVAFGGGVAAPSANRFGRVSPTSAADVADDLGDDVELVLDGGACAVGVESTIVDVTADPPVVLRPGGVTVEQLERVLGRPVQRHAPGPSRAPGMLASHYAPAAEVVLAPDATSAEQLVRAEVARGRRVALLAPAVDAEAWAEGLYRWLRDADRRGVELLVVVPPPPGGLGDAVRDRLRKAAAPRSARSHPE